MPRNGRFRSRLSTPTGNRSAGRQNALALKVTSSTALTVSIGVDRAEDCDVTCDVTSQKDDGRRRFAVIDGCDEIRCNSTLRRIFITLCHAG